MCIMNFINLCDLLSMKWGENLNISRLVKQAQKGNKEALLQLIIAEQDAYYRLAYSYMRNEHDAMDALEDMIVTLYEKLDQLQKTRGLLQLEQNHSRQSLQNHTPQKGTISSA